MVEKKKVKGKYGALIQKAREQENQISGQPDDQEDSEPDNQEEAEGNQPDNQATRQTNTQKTKKPDNQIASKPENKKEREVNLCVKVPESLRRHWAAEAKRQGITMTEVMVEALIQKFGKPDNQ
jgi:predicted HicB family RNase H-like nuclease